MPQQETRPPGLRPREQELLAWLGGQQGAMVGLLAELVNLDSGSYNKRGVDAVGARLVRFFAEHDIATSVIGSEQQGDVVRAQVGAAGGANAPILLMGHRDTVFPEGE